MDTHPAADKLVVAASVVLRLLGWAVDAGGVDARRARLRRTEEKLRYLMHSMRNWRLSAASAIDAIYSAHRRAVMHRRL